MNLAEVSKLQRRILTLLRTQKAKREEFKGNISKEGYDLTKFQSMRLDAYDKQIKDLKTFLYDLDEVTFEPRASVTYTRDMNQFKEIVKKADYSEILFDGKFVKIASIETFPYPRSYITWISTTEFLKKVSNYDT